MRSSIVLAGILAALPLAAMGLPGQSVADFKAWAHGNHGLGTMTQKTGEMSGQPYFTGSVKGGPKDATFMANIAQGKVADESIGVGFTVANHLAGNPKLLSTVLTSVYGSNVASDQRRATLVGSWTLLNDNHPTELYRGQRYGYEVAFGFVKVIERDGVNDEAKYLARCSKMECGD